MTALTGQFLLDLKVGRCQPPLLPGRSKSSIEYLDLEALGVMTIRNVVGLSTLTIPYWLWLSVITVGHALGVPSDEKI